MTRGFRGPATQSRRIKATQRLIERGDIADLRMVGEKRDHIAALAEHIFSKSLQCFFRTDFHEDSRPRLIERAQALDELHRSGDLFGQDVQHLGHDVRPRGIELAVGVGDDGQTRRREMQALQHSPQRLTGGRHNRGVERMADR